MDSMSDCLRCRHTPNATPEIHASHPPHWEDAAPVPCGYCGVKDIGWGEMALNHDCVEMSRAR